MKKKVLIIYTGGTIGCLKNSQGKLAPVELNILRQKYLIKYNEHEFISTKNIIDSSHLNIDNLIEISNIINNTSYDKIVILHGTDTICYAASWLKYFFDDKKSIAITGSMATFADIKNDCYSNIDFAIQTVNQNKNGVYLCFDDFAFNPHYTEKINTNYKQNSFIQLIKQPISKTFKNSKFDPELNNNKHFNWNNFKKQDKSILHVHLNPFVPYIDYEKFDAISLSIYGNGTINETDEVIKNILKCKNIYINNQPYGGIVDFKYDAGKTIKNNINIKLIASISTPSLICFANIHQNYIFENCERNAINEDI